METQTIRTYNSVTLAYYCNTSWDTQFPKPLIVNYTIK